MIPSPVYSLLLCVMVTIFCATLSAQPSASPEALYDQILRNPQLEQEPGEGWAWHARSAMDRFVQGYEATDDRAWLDQGVRYYEWVIDRMRTGPDGYRGWIGPYIYDNDRWADVHIGDAILLNPMLRFAELVLADPQLEQAYGDKARAYVELTEKHLFEKWDARGTWYEDGPYGAYHSWDHYLLPGDLSQWRREEEIRNSSLGLPFNKNNAMGIAALRLYRITGDARHRERAQKMFATAKSRIQLHEDTYIWNYWEPVVPSDFDPQTNTFRHWVGVHPFRNYQAGEVAEIVEAYHSGIVFDEQDIRRIINTNLKVMWNGDMENPRFVNSNDAIRPGPRPENHTAGTLWTALSGFDATVRALRHRNATDEPPQQSTSFERRLMKQDDQVQVFDFPFSSVRHLHMAFVMPSRIERGQEAIVSVKSMVDGQLEVALYSDDGSRKIATLHQGRIVGGTDGREGFHTFTWSGTGADDQAIPDGAYRLRWTLEGDGYREFPVVIGRSVTAAR
jgi:hypothetical protein